MTPSKDRAEFERCWHWLEASIERYGHTHAREHIWWRIETDRSHFWPGQNSALLTEFWNHPTGLKTLHGWLAGGDLAEILVRCVALEEFGIANGAHRVVVSARKGWIRVFPPGYRELSRRIMKVLIDDPRLPRQQTKV